MKILLKTFIFKYFVPPRIRIKMDLDSNLDPVRHLKS